MAPTTSRMDVLNRRDTLGLMSAGFAAGLTGCASADLSPNTLTTEQIANGLTPEQEYFFAARPENPEMRESTSIWLYEESGQFGFPRIGIEAEATAWENRLYTANFAPGDDRVLRGAGRGAAPSPFGADGRPRIFGAGPVTFRLIEPFRRWAMSYDGEVIDGTVTQQMSRTIDATRRIPVRLDVEMEMATPCWVEDNSPARLAQMSEAERLDAASMGIGWRLEHLFRARGTWTIDGVTRDFRGLGSRIKRQSVRPLMQFRGHVWQSALFPDGRAFGYIAYPPRDAADAAPYNRGYVFQNGRMYSARATVKPFLRRLFGNGEDVSLELEYEHGTARIGGVSTLSTYTVHGAEMAAAGAPGFSLQQGGARYTWDGQSAYGMLERSALDQQMDRS